MAQLLAIKFVCLFSINDVVAAAVIIYRTLPLQQLRLRLMDTH